MKNLLIEILNCLCYFLVFSAICVSLSLTLSNVHWIYKIINLLVIIGSLVKLFRFYWDSSVIILRRLVRISTIFLSFISPLVAYIIFPSYKDSVKSCNYKLLPTLAVTAGSLLWCAFIYYVHMGN